VDEQRGMHNYTEKKAVTLSLITSDIDGWYRYASEHSAIEMRSEEISETERCRAFVGYDPEGYYLEWDIFNSVTDNEKLVEAIDE
jgi:hypothetical protein